MQIGVLALQGNVREHRAALERLGAEAVDVRLPEQLSGLDGLILPGGESTAIGRLMRTSGLDEGVASFPGAVFGTCAGMILLAREATDGVPGQPLLGLLDAVVRRNGYGRQIASFETDIDLPQGGSLFHAIFIRAPRVESVGPDVETLAELDGSPVLLRQGRLLAAAFHPELRQDDRVHELFLELVREEIRVGA